MKMRLCFLPRHTDGTVRFDGTCLADCFDNCDHVPRIGETVVLPDFLLDAIPADAFPRLRRFVVVAVEHRWESLVGPQLRVGISTLLT